MSTGDVGVGEGVPISDVSEKPPSQRQVKQRRLGFEKDNML